MLVAVELQVRSSSEVISPGVCIYRRRAYAIQVPGAPGMADSSPRAPGDPT